jgi:16S rRNA (cytidine1402-2'-O)-methyltransferase
MNVQTNSSKPGPNDPIGCLYLVATPIGNLEDITVRALRVLGEVDLIACEDTRRTAKLLNHYSLKKETLSYHEHNEMIRAPELIIRMEQGARVALVSDAGTPVISDPGHHLVNLCLRHRIPVIPIPGPSALIAALAVSGLPTEEFVFVGFLPSRTGDRRKALDRLASETRTLIFYEAPHRLVEMLAATLDRFGRRPTVIARELTKIHEEFLRGDLAELLVVARRTPLRGEVTVLIGGAQPGEAPIELPTAPLRERVEQIMREQNVQRNAALKQAARERGLTRREAYEQLLASR